MKIFVNGKAINLTQKNYVTKGGEGKIFKRGDTAFKIYEDLQKMIPLAKIGELNQLVHPSIVHPKDPIYNESKHLIGFTMDWLDGNIVALCKLFTNTFRDNNKISSDSTIELVENIKNATYFIHQHKCLIVDGNELNYMVEDDFVTPYFIDVNSWKTPSFGATAIMPSIRDWSTDDFNEGTDWFSFAIVAFQLFVGIHPFKGKHKGYKKNDFRQRIIDGVSVFNTEVTLPPTVRDFNLIPSSYKDWFFKMFEHGNRKPPPHLPGDIGQIQVTVHLIQSTDNFEIRELLEFEDNIIYHNSQLNLTKTQSHIYLGKSTKYKIDDEEVVFTPLEQLPIFVKIVDDKVQFKCIGQDNPSINLTVTDKMIVNNILYLRNGDKLMEMDFKVMGGKVHSIIKRTWNIEANSSKLFSNVIYQSALGTTVLAIPTSTYTQSSFITKRIPELDDFQIMDAKYDNGVCVLIGHKSSRFTRIVIIFDEKHDKYRCRYIHDIDYAPINFVCLDNGVCVMLTDDDAIEIFLNKVNKPDVKRIEDPVINSTMQLCKDGTILKFFRDNKIYKIKMK